MIFNSLTIEKVEDYHCSTSPTNISLLFPSKNLMTPESKVFETLYNLCSTSPSTIHLQPGLTFLGSLSPTTIKSSQTEFSVFHMSHYYTLSARTDFSGFLKSHYHKIHPDLFFCVPQVPLLYTFSQD